MSGQSGPRGAAALAAAVLSLLAAETRAQVPRPADAPGQCADGSPAASGDAILPARLADSLSPRLRPLVTDAETHRLQILVGEVIEREGQKPCLRQRGYRVDAEYFYPASSIKILAAIAALESLSGEPWTRDVNLAEPLYVHAPSRAAFEGLSAADRHDAKVLAEATFEPTRAGSLEALIAASLVVSSNAAFNRLFDVAGHEHLNRAMWSAGLDSARLRHRLFSPRTKQQERFSPAISVPAGRGALEPALPARTSDLELPPLDITGQKIGSTYIEDGAVRTGPMDFSGFNYLSLRDHQALMIALHRPELTDVDFSGLGREHRELLTEAMLRDPAAFAEERGQDLGADPERRFKPARPGVAEVLPRERIRYYNKGGRAYGFHIENAYIADARSDRGVFLTAVAYVNENRRLNDNVYEYDELSFPLFHELGELVARRAFAR